MKDWKLNLANFKDKYLDEFEACYVVGSTVYTDEFRDNSDIDLLVVLRDRYSWKKICSIFGYDEGYYLETINSYDNDDIQYFSLKFEYEGIPYSADFCFPEFLSNAVLDVQRTKTPLYFKGCNEKQEAPFDRIFCNRKLTVNKINKVKQHSINVSLPLFYTGEYIYFGILTDKFLTGTVCEKDNDNYSQLIKEIEMHATRRFITLNRCSIPDLVDSLARSYRFGESYKKVLIDKIGGYLENE